MCFIFFFLKIFNNKKISIVISFDVSKKINKINMTSLNLNRSLLQFFPYHLVSRSPWPLLVSFSLLVLTLSAVMYMQGLPNGGYLLLLGLILTLSLMGL